MPGTSDWREPILKHFALEISAVSPVTIAMDPDALLLEQRILDRMRAAGFELVPYEDPVAFRLSYETSVRRRNPDRFAPAMVVHARSETAEKIPFDILAKARVNHRVLQFTIGDLFPGLSPGVVRILDRTDFDALWDGYSLAGVDQMGERASLDFVLRHVFKLGPEMITDVPELLRTLLDLHHSGRVLPEALAKHFVEQLEARGRFTDWPLAAIIPQRQAFLAFLQERWISYLQRKAVKGKPVVSEVSEVHYYAGPDDLPFDHDSVRVYVDTFFLDGLLAPVEPPPGLPSGNEWFQVGVIAAEGEPPHKHLDSLAEKVKQRIPTENATYREWLTFAPLWGEWLAAVIDQVGAAPTARDDYRPDWLMVQAQFQEWLIRHFPSLCSLSYLPQPPMVHHVPHYLNAKRDGRKCALIVVDGMAFSQWTYLRDSLHRHSSDILLDERATFAWIPTITPVSRQAMFSGELPMHFGSTIHKTDRDQKGWKNFWERNGVTTNRSAYLVQKRKEPDTAYLERIREAVEDRRCEVVGIVLSTIDQSLHGAVTGSSGVAAIAASWAGGGHFANLVRFLLQTDFDVYVSSDHGNAEVRGTGRIQTGELSEGGERVHIFDEEIHRHAQHQKYTEAIAWAGGTGLPDDYLPLIAPLDQAFTHPGTVAVTHGGLTVEEVIVPFVGLTNE